MNPTFRLSSKEWIAGILLLAFCFFSFQHGDLYHTASCSVSYLRGHWSDFYDWNQKLHGTPNYLPTTYLIYALWGLPAEILGLIGEQPIFNHPGWGSHFLLWYYKLLGIVFLGLTTLLVVKISNHSTNPKSSSKTSLETDLETGASFATHPILIYSAICFGQYDIFTAFFTLWGYYFYLQRKIIPFSILFGIAITFKDFPAFAFFPLLLLLEKQLRRWIIPLLLFVIPTGIEILLYRHSPSFTQGVLGFAFPRTFAAKLSNGVDQFSILFTGWTLICAYAWWLRPRSNYSTLFRWSSYLVAISYAWAFIWIHWHPQWLLQLAVFLSLASLPIAHRRVLWVMDFAMMALFTILVARLFKFNADTTLMSLGLWNWLFPKAEYKDIAGIFFIKNFPIEIALAGFNALLLATLYTLHPAIESRWNNEFLKPDEVSPSDKRVFWLRFAGGTALFVIPATIKFLMSHSAS